MRKSILIVSGIGLVAFAVVVAASLLVSKGYEIIGVTMKPTLEIGDKVPVDRDAYDSTSISRGDIVIYKVGSSDHIGRVIGLGGETISWRDGRTYINEEVLNEPYISNEFNRRGDGFLNMEPVKLGESQILIMGDNRDQSVDGRRRGPIQTENVIGKVVLGRN